MLWHKPTDSTHVTSPYGPRKKPNSRATSYHIGTDYRAPVGANVYAIGDGVVTFTGSNKTRGNYLRIDHGAGVVTLMQHLSAIKVTRGQRVRAGEVVALAGATGNVTGAHLHFEVHVNGKHTDPVPFLRTARPAAGGPSGPLVLGARELRRGMTGPDVKDLQRILNAWYPKQPNRPLLALDGSYGPRTEARVRYFQQRARLRVDGIAGRKTLGELGVTVRF